MSWNALKLVTPPSGPFISLDRAKQHLRIYTTDDDDYITGLIATATAFIEGPRGIGRALLPATWRMTLDAYPHDGVIRLPYGPVTSVLSVTYLDTTTGLQTLSTAAYYVDLDHDPARIIRGYGSAWPITAYGEPGTVRVTFIAGEANPPADLAHAALLIIGTLYEQREGVVGLERTATPTEMPLGVEAILARYRAVTFG